MNKLPLLAIGLVLIAVGLGGIAARVLALETGLASVLIGGTAVTFGLRQNGVTLPKAPSLLVWMIIAITLFAIFYFTNVRG